MLIVISYQIFRSRYKCSYTCSSCLCLQGPYDTAPMLHGCDGLEGGKIILTLDTGVNCSFSRQLSLRLNSSHHDHAISIQTLSGNILGCGRLERSFSVNAIYKGSIVLSQHTPYFPTVALPDFGHLTSNVLEGLSGTSVFDPWNAQAREICSATTFDQIPVGKLTCRQPEWLFSRPLLEVPLIGSATILGHMVCIILKHTQCLVLYS